MAEFAESAALWDDGDAIDFDAGAEAHADWQDWATAHPVPDFALDMGQPLRIVDLARDLIRLSGMKEGRDVDLIFTGLRPGEKMNEQLYAANENFGRTAHEKIFVCRQHGTGADTDHWTAADRSHLHQHLERLSEAARQGDTPETLALIGRLSPSFQNGDAASVEVTLSTEKKEV